MILDNWAKRWNISPDALQDLRREMGMIPEQPKGNLTGEAAAQQKIRLEAPKHGVYLWRNNNGACYDQEGRLVRYGLANDSKQISEKLKSSDLIGCIPVTITQEHIGKTLGIFTSIEVKKPGWKFTGTKRELAQAKWLQLIMSLGGVAQFATGPGDIWRD